MKKLYYAELWEIEVPEGETDYYVEILDGDDDDDIDYGNPDIWEPVSREEALALRER